MSEWVRTTLGEFISLRRGHDLPQSRRKIGPVPVVGSGGITGWHDTSVAPGSGVTIGRAANLGVPTLVECDYWPLNTTLYVDDFRGNDVLFTYHFLKTLDLTGFNSGSVQPMLNRNYIRNVPIIVPKYSEQRAISSVLGALDDKIAVNERISCASLALAGAHYERAAAGDTWRTVTLADAAIWYSGGTPSTKEHQYWGGDIPWISAASIKSPWIDGSDRCVTVLGSANGTRLTPKGSVIFVVRGMSLKTEFRIGITQREVAFGQDCKALVARDVLSPHILFHGIMHRTADILDLVDEAGHGTGRLATDRIEGILIRVPEDPADIAVEQIQGLNDIAAAQQRESAALAELRDALLPKLMSGEIRVRDAEKIVEDVT